MSDFTDSLFREVNKLTQERDQLLKEVKRIWDIHNDFLNGPYTQLQKEVHQLREEAERLTRVNCELANIQDRTDSDICPACATEFMAGTFKAVGSEIYKERDQLKEQVRHLRDDILKVNYSERLLIAEQERDQLLSMLGEVEQGLDAGQKALVWMLVGPYGPSPSKEDLELVENILTKARNFKENKNARE